MKEINQGEIWAERCIQCFRNQVEKIKDPGSFFKSPTITLKDCLMSCFAVF